MVNIFLYTNNNFLYDFNLRVRSLINKRSPWGTADIAMLVLDYISSITKLYDQFDKYEESQDNYQYQVFLILTSKYSGQQDRRPS